MMKVLRFYILYRLEIILFVIALGIVSHIYFDAVSAWLCYIFAFISLILYFMMGTMRIVQEAVTEGDVENAAKYLKKIIFPRLLFKPIRSGYYMLQSNLALATNNLDAAENNIRKSLKTKSSILGDMEGVNMMQLGFIELKKGNSKQARIHLLEAVKAGIKDNESLAATYLQLCSLEAQRMQYKIAKEYYRKAKALKPKTEEIAGQIKKLEKDINRMPG